MSGLERLDVDGIDEGGEPQACAFCGEDERCSLFEVWGREFMLDTCCQGMLEEATAFLNEDPKAAARWLDDELGLALVMRRRARRVIDSGAGALLLDWNLEVEPVAQKVAKQMVREYHRHCPPPAGWRFGAAVRNGPDIIGVAMVGRPVSRVLDQQGWLEVNRLCIRDDLADGLVWNACSLMYGWAAREAKKRGFRKIVTYTLASESGASLRAAGWVPEARSGGGSWDTPSRRRTDKTSTEPKIRWAPAWCAGQALVAANDEPVAGALFAA